MAKQLTFGQFVASAIQGASGGSGKVIRVDAGFFNVPGLMETAQTIDQTIFMAQLEGRKLTKLESFAIEVLLALPGWKDLAEASAEYQKYVQRQKDQS